jgi:hypothetical protein
MRGLQLASPYLKRLAGNPRELLFVLHDLRTAKRSISYAGSFAIIAAILRTSSRVGFDDDRKVHERDHQEKRERKLDTCALIQIKLEACFIVRDANGQAGCTDGHLTLLLGHA